MPRVILPTSSDVNLIIKLGDMNKSDLIEIVATQSNISLQEASAAVNVFFDSMCEALVDGERIEIRGFGSFVAKQYGAYAGRNPKTGEPIQVPAKRLAFFKVGKELKERFKTDRR